MATTPDRRPVGGIGAAIAAAEARQRRSLLRNHGGGSARVSELELFFDLVYVFAVTQLSHFLLGSLTPLGALQTAILFAAVWWAWMFTTWATNWVDPDRAANRLMIGTVMLLSLVMSAAIPTAFGSGGLIFALSYVAIQLGRSFYVSWAMERDRPGGGRNLLRIGIWFCATAPLWIGGGLSDDTGTRIALWLLALGIDYNGPLVFFPVPGLGRSQLTDWVISGSHMAERCGLFIIIALGEGLILIGSTYAGAPTQPGLNWALVNAFTGSFAMWWLYFDMGARRGAHHIENHALPGLVARQAFTYWHIPIVAGIIVLAVADELVMAHPLEPAHIEFVAIVVSGMLLFLAGLMGFKRISSRASTLPFSHWIGIAAALMLGLWGWLSHPPSLLLFAGTTLIFALVAAWEWGSYHGGWMERMEQRGWKLGGFLRQRTEARRAVREANEG
ncbi:MAG: low temperature requirement protein A [Novosphingobium sp.]